MRGGEGSSETRSERKQRWGGYVGLHRTLPHLAFTLGEMGRGVMYSDSPSEKLREETGRPVPNPGEKTWRLGLGAGGSRADEERFDLGYVRKVEPIKLPDGLDAECERKGVQGGSQVFGLKREVAYARDE